MEWFVLSDEEVAELDVQGHEQYPKPVHSSRCPCGRFAKYLGDRHYYNGWFDCYSYTVRCVRCSRCGDVTVECV